MIVRGRGRWRGRMIARGRGQGRGRREWEVENMPAAGDLQVIFPPVL